MILFYEPTHLIKYIVLILSMPVLYSCKNRNKEVAEYVRKEQASKNYTSFFNFCHSYFDGKEMMKNDVYFKKEINNFITAANDYLSNSENLDLEKLNFHLATVTDSNGIYLADFSGAENTLDPECFEKGFTGNDCSDLQVVYYATAILAENQMNILKTGNNYKLYGNPVVGGFYFDKYQINIPPGVSIEVKKNDSGTEFKNITVGIRYNHPKIVGADIK